MTANKTAVAAVKHKSPRKRTRKRKRTVTRTHTDTHTDAHADTPARKRKRKHQPAHSNTKRPGPSHNNHNNNQTKKQRIAKLTEFAVKVYWMCQQVPMGARMCAVCVNNNNVPSVLC